MRGLAPCQTLSWKKRPPFVFWNLRWLRVEIKKQILEHAWVIVGNRELQFLEISKHCSIKKHNNKKIPQFFYCVKTVKRGTGHDRGECTNLLQSPPPPQFSIFCGWQQGQSPGNWILSLKWLSILWVKCFQMPLKNLPDHTKDKMR